jgi:hypothetical protein
MEVYKCIAKRGASIPIENSTKVARIEVLSKNVYKD